MRTSTPATLRIHLGLVLAELVCVPAFLFELLRARSGNTLSWAYVFEWPILGAYAVYMWAKMLREERGTDARSVARQERATNAETDDPELAAWNAYLAQVHGTAAQVDDEKRDD